MRALAGLALLVFALYAAAGLIGYLTQPAPLYPDFFGLWSFAKFIQSHPATQIYDPVELFAFQRQFEHGANVTYTCPYPPAFLLLLWPLGLLPYVAARSVWLIATLAAFLLAICGLKRQPVLALAAALAPATTVCMIYGQNGLLSAALIIGGMRLAQRRPLVAGVLLGAMIYKPQLALLVPFALAAAGLWRVIASASATVVAVVAISEAVFGWDIWLVWYRALPLHSRLFDASREHLNHLMPTVVSAVLPTGNTAIAYGAQAVAAVAAIFVVWRCWRAQKDTEALVVLIAATFLATPYALVYDLPVLAGAVLCLIASRGARNASFTFADILALMMVLVLPVGLMSDMSFVGAPLAVASLVFVVWQMARIPIVSEACTIPVTYPLG
jgi:hypothetical protein